MSRRYTIKQYAQTYYNNNIENFAHDANMSMEDISALLDSDKIVLVEQGKHTLLDSSNSILPVIPFNVYLKKVESSVVCFSYGDHDFEVEINDPLPPRVLVGDESVLKSLEIEYIYDSVLVRVDSKFEIAIVNNEIAYHSRTGDYRLIPNNDNSLKDAFYVTVEEAIHKASKLGVSVFFDELPIWTCRKK